MNGPVRRLLVHQWRTVASLWWWIRRRRRDVGPGDLVLGYAREQTPMLVALAGVLCLETAIVGLLVPWPVVHVLDVLAVLQVLCIAATAVTRPHYLHDDVLTLREGPLFEVHVPLTSVVTVRAERKYHSGRTLQLTGQQDSADTPELSIVIGSQTDVFVTLSEPVAVVEPNGTIGKAETLRFRADEPAAAVDAIKAAADRSRANTSNSLVRRKRSALPAGRTRPQGNGCTSAKDLSPTLLSPCCSAIVVWSRPWTGPSR